MYTYTFDVYIGEPVDVTCDAAFQITNIPLKKTNVFVLSFIPLELITAVTQLYAKREKGNPVNHCLMDRTLHLPFLGCPLPDASHISLYEVKGHGPTAVRRLRPCPEPTKPKLILDLRGCWPFKMCIK